MGRVIKGHCRGHFRPTPYPIPSNRHALEKIDWEQAICSVCLEVPHNAVLLLCSSHDKGCRSYMCDTSFRQSNCLDLFKKYYAKPAVTASPDPQEQLLSLRWPSCKKCEPTELTCPLCRGKVKGWTVVEPARLYLNKKKRSCAQDGCSFIGTYRELKQHVKAKHRQAKPWKVDPVLEEKWRALKNETEQEDVMSIIRSSMPRAIVMGDYAIEMDSGDSSGMDGFDDGDEDDEFDDDGDDGGGSFLRGRGASRDIRRRIFYVLLQNRLTRARRENTMHEEFGGNGGRTVNSLSDEDDVYSGGGDRSRGRPVNLTRDRRRRQRQGRRSRRDIFDLMA